ncbi:hypothetical protein RIVM261_046770 [Rivularia sp. IAM M-261]|nr:hypothetical protein RIVM261_046770 [Rivularia sp. IAM M-261]
MFSNETRLDPTVPIPVIKPFHVINEVLLDLLRDLAPVDWTRPTIHKDRNVKDLTAHLLHGSIRRVSSLRDSYRSPMPSFSGIEELVAFIQQDNREFMMGMRRVSPQVLIELIEIYDKALISLFEKIDANADGLGVVWAGETVSRNWFDIAREYTEKWHHQQQLRDATERPPLYTPSLLTPVLETFARGLPFAYCKFEAHDGVLISISTTEQVTLGWTLKRERGTWSLWSGINPAAQTSIIVPAHIIWRIWTKSLLSDEAKQHVQVVGDADAVAPLIQFVAIMA